MMQLYLWSVVLSDWACFNAVYIPIIDFIWNNVLSSRHLFFNSRTDCVYTFLSILNIILYFTKSNSGTFENVIQVRGKSCKNKSCYSKWRKINVKLHSVCNVKAWPDSLKDEMWIISYTGLKNKTLNYCSLSIIKCDDVTLSWFSL